jgi:hypothetical protein
MLGEKDKRQKIKDKRKGYRGRKSEEQTNEELF